MTRVWGWILVALGVVSGALTWLFVFKPRNMVDGRGVELAEENARMARDEAERRLTDAIERGRDSISAVDDKARREVNDANNLDLADYLNNRDPGPRG